MNNEEYSLCGFLFSNEADFTNAKDELNIVEYIKNNSNLENEAVVYKLFNGLYEKKAFKTVIGIKFHSDLRDKLLKSGNYKEEDLKFILVPANNEVQKPTIVTNNIISKTDNVALKNAKIVNVFLVLTILAMFIVNMYT